MPDANSENPLERLHQAGQSIWLDFIDRPLLRSGDLARRIAHEALTGMTSNPTIFEKALAERADYDTQLRAAAGEQSAQSLFELVATTDVRDACDAFRGVYDATDGVDGYVSLEVSPAAAHDADATVVEAHRLWAAVDRPNLMIKVPGTGEGTRAVRRLIGDGINVNVTLLFAVEAHARVIEAYLAGLEDRLAAGGAVNRLASVASFFISRVDTEVDRRIELHAAGLPEGDRDELLALRGRAAVANAKLAYALFRGKFSGERWQRLVEKGARVQRPLWASTSTKNPAYRDVMYVEDLIGPDTVNTMPPATVEAFRDHGIVRRTVDEDVEGARVLIDALDSAGISMRDVTDKLLVEGLASFQKSYDSLIQGLERKARELGKELAAR